MYERMLDKALRPEPGQICAYMGADAYARLSALETALAARYDLTRELRFPFGNSYGWGYKYAHRSTHLCYAFFEKGAFTLMVQIGDRQVRPLERALAELSEKARELWANRYPCGEEGGWVRDRVLCDTDLEDVIRLIQCKKPPVR